MISEIKQKLYLWWNGVHVIREKGFVNTGRDRKGRLVKYNINKPRKFQKHD